MYIQYLFFSSSMQFVRDEKKDEKIRADKTRGGYGFEDVVEAIESGRKSILILNPSSRYKNQKMFIIDLEGYIYCVPCEIKGNTVKLITLYPDRKRTKRILGK